MSYCDKFTVYGPYFQNGEGSRQIVVVFDKKTGKKRTVSYPKWIYECHVGRELDPDNETVDHINGDYLDNRLENLKLVPRKQHSTLDTRRTHPIELVCLWCNKKFHRSPRILRSQNKKNKAGPFCSRSCAGKYSYTLKLKLIDKLETQPFIESEYYKNKTASLKELVDLYEEFVNNLERENA